MDAHLSTFGLRGSQTLHRFANNTRTLEENQKEPRKNKQSPNTHLWKGEEHSGQRIVLEIVLKSTQVSSQHPSWHTIILGQLVLSGFQDSEEQAGNLDSSRSSRRVIRSRGVQRQETVVLPRTQASPLSICGVNICACVFAKLFQLCLALCDPMDYSPPGSSVHGILQARILKWIAISFSKGSSPPKDHTVGWFFTVWATREAQSESVSHSVVFNSLWPHGL